MKIYNLKDKIEYVEEVAQLEYEEWADNKEIDKVNRISKKKNKIINMFNEKSFCKLILLDEEKLIGFVSIFPYDCDELPDLTPWYATMYVKKEYRKKDIPKYLMMPY